MERVIKYAVVDGKELFNFSVSNRDSNGDKLSDLSDSQLEKAYNSSRWGEVREIRDRLIRDTDWTQVSDSPLSSEKKEEFAIYRQALRDITETYSDPDLVVFPPKPETK
ncbi:hypothetical protein H4G63_004523 [Salmonella enterica]|nr:hypothetical protein [Salmonella enterica]EGE9999203.1 hypothetical protein [Salmonella enterica]EGN9571854.1 hypothetical protein [Salmonella enterica]EHU3740646.1 phage tail assembly chaperone [Salmonella enterica]EHW9253336.1 phage tail assembly chaperone [Salmonella enterica]